MPGFDHQAQERLARELKEEARRLGFDACGIAAATRLDEDARRLEQWLLEGRHGTMGYMENHFDKRVDPRELVPGARTVVSLIHNYFQELPQPADPDAGKISRYAWGDDYHHVMKDRLAELYDWLDQEAGGIDGRMFVDSAPVLDRAWARRAGLGWVGKNTMLLNRNLGSFFFLGELIIDMPLPADGPIPDYCGSCTRCIDACPTDALYQPYALDANRCISYQTIENRQPDIREDLKPHLEGWVFGCDICQDVCPWNKFAHATAEPRYLPRPGRRNTSMREWEEISIEEYRERFRRSAVKRTKHSGLVRNARAAREGRLLAAEGRK
ncbi:tRNA epoxyqueuosine(34) reductase QueG [soil metagenome]